MTAEVEPPGLRRRLVEEAVRSWTRQLIDLGGRNNLLYFRDLKVGTLDLTPVLTEATTNRLLEGSKVRLSQLFPEPEAQKDAAKRARALRARAIENEEERGLQTLFVGAGLATWKSDRSAATPNAPVLLFALDLVPLGVASEDFTLQLTAEPELNPTLLHLLEIDFGVRIPAEEILLAGDDGEPAQLGEVRDRLLDACRLVPGFGIADRVVTGNFSYAKLPMVRDLERAGEAIEEHDLLSAIAGDHDAVEAVRDRHAVAEEMALPAVPPPQDEYIILDADSSQSRVIAAAVSGADIVVIGPPGTGKSQTISNLIGTLAARGKSVLFVAEKRAAIDAVVKRLQQRELGDLVLDLHDGASNRRRVAGELARALESAGAALAPDVSRLHRQLERRRDELEEYAGQLHNRVAPWDLSAYETQSRILGIPERCRTTLRFPQPVLDTMTPAVVTEACEDLRRFVELGGGRMLVAEHPLYQPFVAACGDDAASVQRIVEALRHARGTALPLFRRSLQAVCAAAGIAEPASLDDAGALVDLVEDVSRVMATFQPGVFDLDLAATVAAMKPARSGFPSQLVASLFNGEYKQARAALRGYALDPASSEEDLLTVAERAADTAQRWRAWFPDATTPRRLDGCDPLFVARSDLVDALERLSAETAIDFEASAETADSLESMLAALEAQRDQLARLPELHRLNRELRDAGLGPAVDAAVDQRLGAEDAALALEHAWLASVLDRLVLEQPALASFTVDALDAATREFAQADRAHIEVTAQRVRRAWAERAVQTRDAYPEESAQVQRQASLRRRHMPLRDLFDRAANVLTAVKPCWVMSPLVVAQVLPARQCFDVVIFDEASQILPADAACSLLRGRRAVIAGDPHQLPPTTFFSAGAEDSDEEQEDEEVAAALETSLTQGQESILDVLRALLPPPYGTRVLSWHYRSKDERLITFSNAQETLYDWSLTTFPGALGGDAMSHVFVPATITSARVTASAPDEVHRVVELVREHATLRPDESLGVIALGNTHSERIAEALRLASIESPEIAAMLDEGKQERFFVKNLERVQGDERDAIILTVGYTKTPDGRMRYNFGPINQEGGQRRLNVAITRARRRMTVVSSFAGAEMDPDRLTSVGSKMLRDYLLYAESGGANLGIRAKQKPALNPFERDVQEHLQVHGLNVIPQYGASGFWIDFAVMDPELPSQPVLAVEADGVMYHSGATARDRDRLRQEHLERLGWTFHRIWSSDWFRAREEEVERTVAAYEAAVRERRGRLAPTAATLVALEPAEWVPAEPEDSKRTQWPGITRGYPITEYSHNQLRRVVAWVKSDGRLYTEDELLAEVMSALGFGRRGNRIVAAIQQAIAAERGH